MMLVVVPTPIKIWGSVNPRFFEFEHPALISIQTQRKLPETLSPKQEAQALNPRHKTPRKGLVDLEELLKQLLPGSHKPEPPKNTYRAPIKAYTI